MKLERRDSGLVVAKEEEKPRQSSDEKHDKLQIQDEDKRALAQEALGMLWDAMSLEEIGTRPNFPVPGDDGTRVTAHHQAYWYLGRMLLGDDCFGGAVLT